MRPAGGAASRSLRTPGSPVELDSGSPGTRTFRTRSAGDLTAKPSVFSQSPQQGTWHADRCASAGSRSPSASSVWRPLASTWREWDDAAAERLHACSSDARGFIKGVVPHWSKLSTVRMKGLIEHDLAWNYSRMKRHSNHPNRMEVGETIQVTDVVPSLRASINQALFFWRDLRPPFTVVDMQRHEDVDGSGREEHSHADGDLFLITYECGLDYSTERKWGQNTTAWTFDNKVKGVARVCIPQAFPQRRPIHIVDWGNPSLSCQNNRDRLEGDPTSFVPPEEWNPLADELEIRPNCARLAAVRQLSQRGTVAKCFSLEADPRKRALLGPHPSLKQLAKMDRAATAPAGSRRRRQQRTSAAGGNESPKLRQHRIYTSAGGFVTYHG